MSNSIFDIEDYLHDTDEVFVSGIDGRPTYSDSYLTVLSFTGLEKAFNESLDKGFTKEEWLRTCEYWKSTSVVVPTLLLAAKYVEKLLENK